MKKELKPGDRVRVRTGPTKSSPLVGDGRIKCEVKIPGVTVHVYDVEIQREDGSKWHDYRAWDNQCRRLRPKAKPERERIERVEIFANKYTVDHSRFDAFKSRAECQRVSKCAFSTVMRLVELKPGEVPVTREALAAAFVALDDKFGRRRHNPVGEAWFDPFCEALGLSTKGEGA